MSHFRYVVSKNDTKSLPMDRDVFLSIINNPNVASCCIQARQNKGKKKNYEFYKSQLPLVFWCGYNEKGSRLAENLTPTQHFIIDIDHAKLNARGIWNELVKDMLKQYLDENDIELDDSNPPYEDAVNFYGIRLAHETPSDGLRLVVCATCQYTTIQEHQTWFRDKFNMTKYGDFDKVVKDLSRGSFMVMKDWIIYESPRLWAEIDETHPILADAIPPVEDADQDVADDSKPTKDGYDSRTLPVLTEDDKNFTFNGKRVAEIAQEYIEDIGGQPADGLRHSFYNELIKNFRNICENDAKTIFAVLPLCDGSPKKRWSQCVSICRRNDTTKIPKDFYFWLKRRGYIKTDKDRKLIALLDADIEKDKLNLPTLPPVFREFCAVCPKDFIYPTIVALMPIMGTLTSYVRSVYIDQTEQSTTFFACIWAPPSCGKSFAKKLVNILMEKIKVRDEINDIREQLWLIDSNTKADNERGKELPHVMVRIMPAINSLPEFLEKMRDNKGYHMFTLAEEVDTFKKGSSSGGADKSDLFRTAWDNSEYGQSFKSTGTFKGKVAVYYNILLTGTPGSVKKYYSNVEDGMVTRISICEIENQQFARFEAWKAFNQKQRAVIDKFIERCDSNTYENPLEVDADEAHLYDNSSENYDKNIQWKFKVKDKMQVDMSWLYPTILEWLEKTRIKASKANDAAMDTFRRRCALKGFRLGLVCYCCWPKITKREMNVIKNFVTWFMDRDLTESMKMFGEKYNRIQEEVIEETKRHQSLFDALPEEFTRKDVIDECIKNNIRSKVKVIIYRWKKDEVITKIGEDKYRKNKKVL